MRLTTDGSNGERPDLTLVQVKDWNTKKQQRILEALLEVDSVDRDGVFDVESVYEKLHEEMGDECPTEAYIYQVKGQYTRTVPKSSENSWDGELTVVQIKKLRGYGQQRRDILELLDYAEVDEDGVIDIQVLGREVMELSNSKRRPSSYIWQTIGEFAATLPVEVASRYRRPAKESGESDAVIEQGTQEEEIEEKLSDTVEFGSDDEGVDPSSYHMGYADGYRAALQERQG